MDGSRAGFEAQKKNHGRADRFASHWLAGWRAPGHGWPGRTVTVRDAAPWMAAVQVANPKKRTLAEARVRGRTSFPCPLCGKRPRKMVKRGCGLVAGALQADARVARIGAHV